MKKGEMATLAILFLFSFVLRLLISLSMNQFILDESNYAQTFDEFAANPSLIPTYLGEPIAWKPPLFFYVYAPFAKGFEALGIPVETAYRLPSIIISSASVLVFYLFLKTFMEREKALVGATIYSAFGLSMFMGALLMTDSLFMLLVFLGMLFYVKGTEQERYFLLAGACSFLAFLTKYHLALMLPLLGASYCFFKSKKLLRNRFFLVSLIGVPLALCINALVYLLGNRLDVFLFSYGFEIFGRASPASLSHIGLNIVFFLFLSLPWVGFAVVGLFKSKWEHFAWKTVFLWMLFAAPVFLNADPSIFWYSLPVLPAIAAMTANVTGGGKLQLLIVLLLSSVSFLFIPQYVLLAESDQKEAGLFLAGKGDSLIIAPEFHFVSWPDYYELYPASPLPLVMSSPGVVFYTLHNEANGKVSAGYLSVNETDVNNLVSDYIKNSNASSIAITLKVRCTSANVSRITECTYNYSVPDGFEAKTTKNMEYTLLKRK